MSEISIRAEEIFRIGAWPVTNALLLSTVVVLFLTGVAAILKSKLAMVPGKFQSLCELIIEQTLKIMDTVLGRRAQSEQYLPLIATIFLFILASNWLGLFPGIGSIGIIPAHHPEPGQAGPALIPLFRAPGADLNFTIALAVISVAAVNILGITAIGLARHLSKFFTLKSPLDLFTGLLEFISEFVRILSFSFRLFGNVFAGEVLLTVISALVPYLLPLPFLFLEIFVGFIQALIFAMLTLVFIGMAVSGHGAQAAERSPGQA